MYKMASCQQPCKNILYFNGKQQFDLLVTGFRTFRRGGGRHLRLGGADNYNHAAASSMLEQNAYV